jgi:dipeptidyl aminopeptidase/acylaminoacyl peptidase
LRSIASCLTLLPGLPLLFGLGRAQNIDSLPIVTALSQPSFPDFLPLSLSPNGSAVAYTVCVQDAVDTDTLIGGFTRAGTMGPARGCTVWVADTRTHSSVRLSGGLGSNDWAPQWSPDGTQVAFYSDEGGVARLWVWDAATKKARAVSDAVVRPSTPVEGPRWTPDSRGVVTRILAAGMTIESAALTPHADGMSWDTVGRASGSTVVIYRTDSIWRRHPRQVPATPSTIEEFYEGDLALIHVATGEVQTLAHGYKPFSYWVSPDGQFVAFTSLHGTTNSRETRTANYLEDLLVVRLNGGGTESLHLVADRANISPYGTGVAWAPHGSMLAYAETQSDGTERYCLVRTSDWRVSSVEPPDSVRSQFAGRSGAQPLRWDPTGRTLYVAADSFVARVDVEHHRIDRLSRPPHGTSIVALIGAATSGGIWIAGGSALVVETRNDSTKRMGFAKIDLHLGTWTQITDEEQYLGIKVFSSSDVSADGSRFVYTSENATRPADVWSATATMADARRITSVAPALSGRRYGATRLIQWRTATGVQVSGALMLPVGYDSGRRYPLIVDPYPLARRSNNVFQFGLEGVGTENMQLLATRGFTVLAPDAPINLTDQMRSLADVILPGVDRVIALGIADSSRLGLIGHSWGGYTVMALLVQTDRFRAAVMGDGYGDLVTDYGEMQPTGSTFGQLRLESWFGATLWQDLPRYIDNSPVFFLDRVRTPLLIVEGGADPSVPPHETTEMFVDLRRLGSDVEYALYGGETHSEIAWRKANQQDYVARIIRWFDSYLSSSANGTTGTDAKRVDAPARN